MHKTQWKEVQRFTFVCFGCCRECMVGCRHEMKQNEDCDGSRKMVNDVLVSNRASIVGVPPIGGA